MSDKTPRPRSRYSYRERIREVIRARIARGDPIQNRDIIKEAGGGSASTVVEEVAKIFDGDTVKPAVLIGAGAKTATQRVVALEQAVNASLAREQSLISENTVLKASLHDLRAELDKLLTSHQDAQRLLLQGVDDLRQMVKAGQGSMPQGVLEAERTKTQIPDQSGTAIYWQAKHDQLLERFVALEAKARILAGKVHELGGEID